MARYKRRLFNWLVPAMLLCLSLGSEAQARSIALLIGVGAYPNLGTDSQLQAPRHDVEAMRDTLQQRWGFAPEDIRTLIDSQATKAGILAALRQLQQRSQPGDEVLVYFTGHGTSDLAPNAFPESEPATGYLVVWDSDSSSIDRLIGKNELKPVLTKLGKNNRRVWYITDSCFSANQLRSGREQSANGLQRRYVPFHPEGSDERKQLHRPVSASHTQSQSEPWAYENVVALTASSAGQWAYEIKGSALVNFPTLDGKPHGALTDALLRVLQGRWPADTNGDGLLSLAEAHDAVTDFMDRRWYGQMPHRLPSVLQDLHGESHSPVLSKRGVVVSPEFSAALPKLRVAVASEVDLAVRDMVAKLYPDRVALVAPTEAPDYHIKTGKNPPNTWELSSANGSPVHEPTPQNEVAKLQLRKQLLQLEHARRLESLAKQHRRDSLDFQIVPSQKGGDMMVGDKVAFAVNPRHQANLVVFDIMADGTFSVLHPTRATGDQPLVAGQRICLPSMKAQPKPVDKCEEPLNLVTEPVGTEELFAFAFEDRPDHMDRWMDATRPLPLDDSLLRDLERSLKQAHGRFTFTSVKLHTFPRPVQR